MCYCHYCNYCYYHYHVSCIISITTIIISNIVTPAEGPSCIAARNSGESVKRRCARERPAKRREQSDTLRLLRLNDRKSRHRSIKKQRRCERLAATSQLSQATKQTTASKEFRYKELLGERQAQTASFCARRVWPDRRLVQARLARARKAVATLRWHVPAVL